MRTFFSLFILLFLSACASQQERTERFLAKNPIFLATQCAANFSPIVRYIPGNTIYDTIRTTISGVELDCPEVTDSEGNKRIPKVKCPDSDIEKIIASRTDTIHAEYTDKLFLLQAKLATQASDIERLDLEKEDLLKSIKTRNRIILSMLAGILVFIIERMFRKWK